MRILIILALIYIIYLLTRSAYPHLKKGYQEGMGKSDSTVLDEMVKDPNCQIYLPKKQAIAEKMNNEWYYFCSEECRRKWKEKVKR
jgi:YHS domain-containing protein